MSVHLLSALFLCWIVLVWSASLTAFAAEKVAPSSLPSVDLNTFSSWKAGGDWFSACLTDTPNMFEPTSSTPLISRKLYFSVGSFDTAPNVVVQTQTQNSNCIVSGFYQPTFEQTGWDYLRIESVDDPSVADELKAYTAGYLEGYLMAERIAVSKKNFFEDMFDAIRLYLPDADTNAWVTANLGFNRAKIRKALNNETISSLSSSHSHSSSSSKTSDDDQLFWKQVWLVYLQLEGIYFGYNDKRDQSSSDELPAIPFLHFVYLNLNGDIDDIISAASLISGTISEQQLDEELRQRYLFGSPSFRGVSQNRPKRLMKNSHCSALVRLTADNDLYTAHTTWGSFSTMIRTFKYYQLTFSNTPGQTIHFSSYPALLSSVDDFYHVLDTQLTIFETTNDILNALLYFKVDQTKLTEWVRAVVATRLADNGAQFGTYFSKENAGTYCNDYFVVDHKNFIPGQPLTENVLQLVSQMPGEMYSADVTAVLANQSYFASYNVPYYDKFYDALGYAKHAEKYGDYLYGYADNFRGLIFRRDVQQVQDLSSMKHAMQDNDYPVDPLSKNCSIFAIASRYDLLWDTDYYNDTQEPFAFGAIDTKLISDAEFRAAPKDTPIHIYSGPTYEELDPFVWSQSYVDDAPHAGMPDAWQFPWVRITFTMQ